MRALFFALLVACGTPEVSSPPPEPAAPPVEQMTPEAEQQRAPVDVVEEAEPPAEPPVVPPAAADPVPAPEPAPAGSVADGAACLLATDCASGICEGQGCDAAEPGTCAPKQRACTRDRRAYCGCDGETFFTSGTCPGRRYAKTGTCE